MLGATTHARCASDHPHACRQRPMHSRCCRLIFRKRYSSANKYQSSHSTVRGNAAGCRSLDLLIDADLALRVVVRAGEGLPRRRVRHMRQLRCHLSFQQCSQHFTVLDVYIFSVSPASGVFIVLVRRCQLKQRICRHQQVGTCAGCEATAERQCTTPAIVSSSRRTSCRSQPHGPQS